ncbi:uncharacterized protein MONOS_12061 [Monocercomonoides exilis]|uniref:uncharacterized protein n=1 Tax=Monocercomonoides exilis TaxID=2049356 RepID=UPI00355982B2|nr:hypothetical protein MONOS_12061 [Monocercomonoides exilis]|eukprot:MONOS_12061.1-p1 / transcript=MONOS_12061.1 / gene=MONOS_12061 / organism=Monocercomonoides_exilis_PA203 / gene_product=unspecified product / transcript_product=unspecified product / location=Mono_scaffold00641:16116-16454(-) / protein_length=113 / sequence_SO=supercontig / SO=protein_coding / is_pseudo=false
MALKLGEDGIDAPRDEKNAAARRSANLDSICKDEKETENKGLSSTPWKVEVFETATPTSEFVVEEYAICAEASDSPRGLEGNGNSQPNDTGRINTLEKDPAREQTEVSEEKE